VSAALTNYWQDFINQMIKSGRYNNRSEVIRRVFVPWKNGAGQRVLDFEQIFAGAARVNLTVRSLAASWHARNYTARRGDDSSRL